MKSKAPESTIGRRWIELVSLLAAALAWIPCVQFFFVQPKALFEQTPAANNKVASMAKGQLHLWRDPASKEAALQQMRSSNSEWDFMGRTFLALALCEMSTKEPGLAREYLPVVDSIIDETLRLERVNGMYFFLMPYAKAQPYRAKPARSLFVDSEIAIMLASRRMVEEHSEYRELCKARIAVMEQRLRASPEMAVESYPDECWTFDHVMGLAAMRISDHLGDGDHRTLIKDWLKHAKAKLVQNPTGPLVSSYSTSDAWKDGPEGSSIWFIAHALKLLDAPFAKAQYQLARQQLGRTLCGFGWSLEWPAAWKGGQDIDSGMVVPILGASPGGSGLALIGAASFHDTEFLQSLHRSLDFAAFPMRQKGELKYAASNAVGDAVILYSMVTGPIWQKITGASNTPSL